MKNWLKKFRGKPVEPSHTLASDAQRHSVDINRVARLGSFALVVGFGGTILWAALAPLDEGVPASGVVIVDSKRKAVQHLQGGIIDKLLVIADGATKLFGPRDQVLANLAEANQQAQLQAQKQQQAQANAG